MGAFVISPLPLVSTEELRNSRAPLLRGRYPVSSLPRARPPPSRLGSTSRGHRLYDLPCSTDFSVGRGGLLQLLDASLSPCRRYHPAGGDRRFSQPATNPAAFTLRMWARPPGILTFGATSAFTLVT